MIDNELRPTRAEFDALMERVAELEARLGRIRCPASPPGAPAYVTCILPFGHDSMHEQVRDGERMGWSR